MRDLSKQPKWVQDLVDDLKKGQNKTEIGANISNCNIENNGVKHTEHTANAIFSLSEAMQVNANSIAETAKALSANALAASNNAEAIKEAAKYLNGGGVDVEFGCGINLSDVKHS